MTTIECIYCREWKSHSAYAKVEHVIPQAFGRFQNNFTLLRLVCDACNQWFGDNLDLALARDTFEGQSRVDFGIIEAQEFKPAGRRSRIRVKIAEGELAGAYAYRDYSVIDKCVTLKPVPQVGFRITKSARYVYFPIDQLPDCQKLELLGLDVEHPEAIKAFNVDAAQLSDEFARRGIPFRCTGGGVPTADASPFLCEVEGLIDLSIQRGAAKIAFNYLAYCEGGDFVRQACFDQIRKFVRYGDRPSYPLVIAKDEAILADEGVEGQRRLGHLITINWASDGFSIVAQVSLCNWLKYSICLARDYRGERQEIARGHFFNLGDGTILLLGTGSRTQGGCTQKA